MLTALLAAKAGAAVENEPAMRCSGRSWDPKAASWEGIHRPDRHNACQDYKQMWNFMDRCPPEPSAPEIQH